MTDRELMRQVLEDICGARLCEVNSMSSRGEARRLLSKAEDALRERLAQPEQTCEELGYVPLSADGKSVFIDGVGLVPLAQPEQPEPDGLSWLKKDSNYFSQPKRKPLTDEEIRHFWREATMKPKYTSEFVKDFARAIEAAHGIKGEA